jgi:Tol biopolymer transport system component
MIGRTLNHYRILKLLGRGGMGEVYLAEDTRLARKVALKMLSPQVAEDRQLRLRFEREARAVAALNHPNIVTIHSVEDCDDIHFITMEVVEGSTLSTLIPNRGFPLRRFLEIAIPLGAAVSTAHEHGITHRDLKPDNVMITEDDRLKVLDFGLAKLREGQGVFPEHGTSTSVTGQGAILGTVAYMSPEQAEGKVVDHRTDIFSLGVMLYELATGRRPFEGESSASIVSSILRDSPESVVNANRALPHELWRIIRRAIHKDPDRRFQTSKDLYNELLELKEALESGETTPGAEPIAVPQNVSRRNLALLIGTAIVALAFAGLWLKDRLREPPPVAATAAPSFTRLTSELGPEEFPGLAPDGRSLVYASAVDGDWDIYLLRVGGLNAINLTPDSRAEDTQPVYSPDGDFIAFRSGRDGGGIFMMGATGESVLRLADRGHDPAWSPDGTRVVFATEKATVEGRASTSELWQVDVSSRELSRITSGDAVDPAWSPDGSRIAYWAHKGGYYDLWTMKPGGNHATPVTQDAARDWNPVWSPDGRFLYFSSDRGGSFNLWRLPMDTETGKATGEPQPMTTGGTAVRAHPSISADGKRIAYVEAIRHRNIHRVPFDPVEERVDGPSDAVTAGSMATYYPDVSPDATWLAAVAPGKPEDILVLRADGSGMRRLTQDHKNRLPRWSPDGTQIAFQSNRSGGWEIWVIDADGSGLKQVTHTPDGSSYMPCWSPDGKRITFYETSSNRAHVLDVTGESGAHDPEPLPGVDGGERAFVPVAWSPDGRSLVGNLMTLEGKLGELLVFSWETGEYRQVSEIGTFPMWLGDSRRLLVLAGGSVVLIDSVDGRVKEVIAPDAPATVTGFAVSRDNRSIFYVHTVSQSDVWMLELG